MEYQTAVDFCEAVFGKQPKGFIVRRSSTYGELGLVFRTMKNPTQGYAIMVKDGSEIRITYHLDAGIQHISDVKSRPANELARQMVDDASDFNELYLETTLRDFVVIGVAETDSPEVTPVAAPIKKEIAKTCVGSGWSLPSAFTSFDAALNADLADGWKIIGAQRVTKSSPGSTSEVFVSILLTKEIEVSE